MQTHNPSVFLHKGIECLVLFGKPKTKPKIKPKDQSPNGSLDTNLTRRPAQPTAQERKDKEMRIAESAHQKTVNNATQQRDADAAQLIDSALNFIERFHL